MKNKLKLLYNPFESIAGWKAFGIGVVFVVISIGIAYSFDTAFRGLLNIAPLFGNGLMFAVLSQLVALLILCVAFYAAGFIFSRGVRFQDVLGTCTLARFPFIIIAFSGYFLNTPAINAMLEEVKANPMGGVSFNTEIIMMIAFSFVMLFVIVWYIALLWNAFRISTGIVNKYRVLIFIVLLIVVDVFSRIISSLLS